MLLDGKATAASIRAALATDVLTLSLQAGRQPGLAVILVGEDPASQVYVRNKERACVEAAIGSHMFRLPAETRQDELLLGYGNLDPTDIRRGLERLADSLRARQRQGDR